MSNFLLAIKTFRDFLLPFLPAWAVQQLARKYDYAFIAHPLEFADISRKYKFLNRKNKKLIKFVSQFLWPVIGSEITGFRTKDGRSQVGVVLFCPMSTRMLILKRKAGVNKLLKTMKLAEKLGVQNVGLGAYVPIVTNNGKLLAKKSRLPITTGTAYSAIIAFSNAIKLAALSQIDFAKDVFAVVGAGGSVGSICARLLLDEGVEQLCMIDKSEILIERILHSDLMKDANLNAIKASTEIETIRNADVIIVATNTPGAIVRSEHLKPGALIIDAAQPRNVSAKVPDRRKDVVVVESGVALVPGLNTNFDFNLRSYSEVFSCLAEVLILMWTNNNNKHVGDFDLDYIRMLKESGPRVGIKIPKFRNCNGYVTRKDIEINRSCRKKINYETHIRSAGDPKAAINVPV